MTKFEIFYIQLGQRASWPKGQLLSSMASPTSWSRASTDELDMGVLWLSKIGKTSPQPCWRMRSQHVSRWSKQWCALNQSENTLSSLSSSFAFWQHLMQRSKLTIQVQEVFTSSFSNQTAPKSVSVLSRPIAPNYRPSGNRRLPTLPSWNCRWCSTPSSNDQTFFAIDAVSGSWTTWPPWWP